MAVLYGRFLFSLLPLVSLASAWSSFTVSPPRMVSQLPRRQRGCWSSSLSLQSSKNNAVDIGMINETAEDIQEGHEPELITMTPPTSSSVSSLFPLPSMDDVASASTSTTAKMDEYLATQSVVAVATMKGWASTLQRNVTPQVILNAIFLAVSFGWVAHTLYTIDSGMTRGWTQSEIAMRIPLDTWNSYEESLESSPIMTKTFINVAIYLLGDWLSQTVFQGKNILDFDISRTLKNGFIGLCFGPLVHEYYAFSDQILPPEEGLVTRMQKIFMDQTIYLTVKCSIYIYAVGLLSGDDLDTCKQTVKDKIGGIVITAWKFWPLVHCVTYGLIPARHRILWVNSVDLIWNAILATQAQKDLPEDDVSKELPALRAAKVVMEGEVSPAAEVVIVSAEDESELKSAVQLNGDHNDNNGEHKTKSNSNDNIAVEEEASLVVIDITDLKKDTNNGSDKASASIADLKKDTNNGSDTESAAKPPSASLPPEEWLEELKEHSKDVVSDVATASTTTAAETLTTTK